MMRPERVAHPSISFVVPVRNEAETLPSFFETVDEALRKEDCELNFVCVNDGSSDNSLEIIKEFARKDSRISVINLSRNFGKEAALSAGLDRVQGDVVILIDADLQDPPEIIPAFIAKWREGYDVVYGLRVSRASDGVVKRLTAGLFYVVFNWISSPKIPFNAGDFRLLDQRVVRLLRQLPERNRFMKGLFTWVGFRQIGLPIVRQPRKLGKTSWSYWRLWNFALDGVTSFSSLPLRVWSYIGLCLAGVGFGYAVVLVIRILAGAQAPPGYASLMVALLVLGGVQLISIGIIGEYIGRLYTEVKARPLYVVDSVYPETDAEHPGENK